MLITVIIAVYNGMGTLPQCLEKIWAQRFHDWELIVVDGASTDGTTEYLKSISEKVDVLISEPDTGVYNAWNKAIKVAAGEWICFVGADDEFASPLVLEQVASVLKNKVHGEKYVYGSINVVNQRGAIPLGKIGVFCGRPPAAAVFKLLGVLRQVVGDAVSVAMPGLPLPAGRAYSSFN